MYPYSPSQVKGDSRIPPEEIENDDSAASDTHTSDTWSSTATTPVAASRTSNETNHRSNTTVALHSPMSPVTPGGTVLKSGPKVRLPLVIKTESITISSGFTYHPNLFYLGVAPDTWEKLSSDIVKAAKLTVGQYLSAIGVGASIGMTGAVGTGVFVGRRVTTKLAVRNVEKSLKKEDGLSAVLDRWNREIFAPRSLAMRLDMPDDILGREGGSKKDVEEEEEEEEEEAERGEKTESGKKKKSSLFKERMPWQKKAKERRRFALVVYKPKDGTNLSKQSSLEEEFLVSELGPSQGPPAELPSGVLVPPRYAHDSFMKETALELPTNEDGFRDMSTLDNKTPYQNDGNPLAELESPRTTTTNAPMHPGLHTTIMELE